MMIQMVALLSIVVWVSLPGGACAEPAPAATSLDQLLEKARQSQAAQRAEDQERERQFLADRSQQARLLEEARAELAAATARSKELTQEFDANELKLKELEGLLKTREGNLGELFGVTRQVAQDVSSVSLNSLISARYPERDDFLVTLAKAKSLPSIDDLSRLWVEMLREMTETGRVARFDTTVVTADGSPRETEVVGIGGFTATAGDEYLNYMPSLKQLAVLPRQPQAQLRDMARGLQEAQSGYVQAIVDPSRGVLMSLYVQRPGLWERIQHGEAVGYVIIVIGALGVLCALYQFAYLVLVRRAVTRQLGQLGTPTPDNPLGRVLASYRGDGAQIEEEAEVAELRISEAVLREVPRLERFQSFLRLAVAAGPLLGLVGTVIGMIITFQSITESGSSDPKLMANGIGQAMIATVLGLGVAIPLLFANAGLASLSKSIVQILDEQSTGLLAEHIEARQRRA
jgi:biopolymer transport protein ExbB